MTVFILTIFLALTTANFMRNQYRIDVESVQLCPDNDQMRNPIKNLKISTFNRTCKTVSYDFEYNEPLTERIGWSVLVERWTGGKWLKIPFIELQPNLCKNGPLVFRDSFMSLHKNVGIKHPEQCPIPAGKYHVRNYVMETTYINYPFWAGIFRVAFVHVDMKTKQKLQCIMHIFKTTEIFE